MKHARATRALHKCLSSTFHPQSGSMDEFAEAGPNRPYSPRSLGTIDPLVEPRSRQRRLGVALPQGTRVDSVLT